MAWTDEECEQYGLRRAVVARGRTVQGPVPGSGKPDVDDPRRVTGTTSRRYMPGETVWLEAHELPRLRTLGYALDPLDPDDAQMIALMFAPAPPSDAPTVVKALPDEETTNIRFMPKA
ncbi:hypothetical protein [Paraburkholderia sp. JPY419]|uniref:hypothetical protein n=1 Tax=Paraburkholderia sp. JPY419 TaxID=667660 RepID=UPI003D24671D